MSGMDWSHREIRRLLRLLSDPAQLELHPTAAALRDVLEATSARDAVIALIRQAIPGTRPSDELLRQVIFRQDVDGIKSHRVAALLGLSIRSYFRYRERAIEAIADAFERELQSDRLDKNQQLQFAKLAAQFDAQTALELYAKVVPEPRGRLAYEMIRLSIAAGQPVTRKMIKRCEGSWRVLALTALSRNRAIGGRSKTTAQQRERPPNLGFDSATPAGARAAFELAYAQRLSALRLCDMAAARGAAERMKTLAHGNAPLAGLALVVEAAQACDDGDLGKARGIFPQLAALNSVTRDPRIVARTAGALSMLAFMECRWDQAYDNARVSAVILEEIEPELAMCENTMAGRAAAQLRQDWSPGAKLCERYPTSWILGFSLAIQSRIRSEKDPQGARDAALRALDIVTRQGARGALCYAQVSLASALDHLGECEEAQRLRVEAWRSAVRLGRETYLHDMFVVPSGRRHDFGYFDLGVKFVDAILDRTTTLCETLWGATSPTESALFTTLICQTLVRCGPVNRERQPSDTLGVAQAAAAWRDSGLSASEGFKKIRVLGQRLAHELAFCFDFADREEFTVQFVQTMYSAAAEGAQLKRLFRAS